jgi:DNA replication initiation complex subunit (GINS family)
LRLEYFQDTDGTALRVDVSRDGGPAAPLDLVRAASASEDAAQRSVVR